MRDPRRALSDISQYRGQERGQERDQERGELYTALGPAGEHGHTFSMFSTFLPSLACTNRRNTSIPI